MKSLLVVLSLLLLGLLASLAGHSAHHKHYAPAGGPLAGAPQAPPRVVRSPAVARQHRLVRAVKRVKS
ncbi:hypothetical protein [Hymenobacter cheonanensis]|uniref:hypothetical protein n=1 Tax=Hymenobacter sp. CA2-7 TaxID=3063993 RepID=UPI0027130EE6|nr:hypothetical protein [Hymenobacter sp. CA2-7]MDO7883783.1 hypothetical protein [Hymenobacter sp. CA2-7]